jgi:hypothetical protein
MLLLGIACAGLIIGTTIFYGNEYENRVSEARVLNFLVGECLKTKNIDWSNKDSFYSACSLSKKILSDNHNETNINILICKPDCTGKRVFQLGSDFESCDFIGINEYYMRCWKSKIHSDKGDFEIVVGSNHMLGRFRV